MTSKPTLRAADARAKKNTEGTVSRAPFDPRMPKKPVRGSAPLARFVKREPTPEALALASTAQAALRRLEHAAARAPEPEPRGRGYGGERYGGERYEGGRDDRNDRNDRGRDGYRAPARSGGYSANPGATRQPQGDANDQRAAAMRVLEQRLHAREDDGGRFNDSGRFNDRPAGGFDRRDDRRDERRPYGPSHDSGNQRGDDRGWGGASRGDRAGRERPPERRFDSRPPERSRDARDHTSAPMRSQYAPPAQPIAQAHHQGPKTDAEKAGGVRLNKRLAELGLCSRREGDQWIDNGWVLVNGEVGEMGQTVSEEDRIDVSPDAHAEQAQQVTILLHKPMGYVSGLPEDGHESAATLIGPQSQWTEDPTRTRFQARFTRGLAPAGRLDIDSTGLIVFTQNGIIARTLIGENSNIEKEYLVRVIWIGDGADAPVEKDVQAEFPEERLALLREGLLLDNQVLKPAKVSWQNTEQLRFVLREGKKRQIRRMCEQVGLKVVGLKRVRIGSINLAQLPVGQWRYLGPTERF